MNNGLSREKLLRQIQIYSFAVYDALLYLDSHPSSKEALDFYNKYKQVALLLSMNLALAKSG